MSSGVTKGGRDSVSITGQRGVLPLRINGADRYGDFLPIYRKGARQMMLITPAFKRRAGFLGVLTD